MQPGLGNLPRWRSHNFSGQPNSPQSENFSSYAAQASRFNLCPLSLILQLGEEPGFFSLISFPQVLGGLPLDASWVNKTPSLSSQLQVLQFP